MIVDKPRQDGAVKILFRNKKKIEYKRYKIYELKCL